MEYRLLDEDAWCYWVVSVGALFSFVALVAACVCSCRRNENKSEFLGLAGMVTIAHPDNEGFNRVPTTDASQPVTQDTTDGGKRSTGANRSLPDIPKDKSAALENRIEANTQDIIYEANETIGDPSELYATVEDKGDARKHVREIPSISQQSSLVQDDAVSPYARLKSPNSNNDEHPYAQVQNIQKTEANSQNRNTTTHLIDTNKPSTSKTSLDIQAASAITGGVQANQDLPYMTPPILMPLPHPPQSQHESPQQHFSGDSQDSKGYTSISVREPLANIIAQTKAAQQQRQSSRTLTDPHYATVSDDSDEMYAAIDEQDKVYTSGSETYAQIQPAIVDPVRTTQSDQPNVNQTSHLEESHPSAPQPPSVDSLRHVAHAHSRQASSSSATSSVANLGSPKPEKRQANSPLPPPPEGTNDVYALVDKRGKGGEDRLRSSVSSGKSLEDMYAKVVKKKRDTEDEVQDAAIVGNANQNSEMPLPNRKLSLIEISRASWSSHDSVEIQKREPEGSHFAATNPTGNFHNEVDIDYLKIQRKSEGDASRSTSGFDHGYEAVDTTRKSAPVTRTISGNDPNYEVLRPQYSRVEDSHHQGNSKVIRNGIDVLPMYSLPFKHRQISNASSEDPGYEKVRLRRRIDLDQDTDSEPNYESMPHDSGEPNYASVCRPGDSDTDPNYESVSHSDPNYESVKYMSVTQNEDPPYEQVNNYKQIDADRDGYEKVRINRTDKGIDSDYEKISLNYSVEQSNDGESDDEQYVQV
ncbi:uncharacterized protein LOC107265003 isoform X2 [Cephus cinctus]|uniref:Uncharacterized protein LOC107265003 isoform X2 n=1 Tax=Cephus cinctus TaxID=211228 RepID=A0AAJ7RCJ9_CEPCN|nr:uncharacterized protein LOC107265003 isoform X2 [Cephus cinctus]